ncbi:unnamed protein product [Meganyctiphanes norvegica]|uniref:NADH dehydrogenase subunit 4L n=1 Tax=Meganyctiphanes norvegica TaxID=48144 RepID=A0AAV2S4J4_MEGNR
MWKNLIILALSIGVGGMRHMTRITLTTILLMYFSVNNFFFSKSFFLRFASPKSNMMSKNPFFLFLSMLILLMYFSVNKYFFSKSYFFLLFASPKNNMMSKNPFFLNFCRC